MNYIIVVLLIIILVLVVVSIFLTNSKTNKDMETLERLARFEVNITKEDYLIRLNALKVGIRGHEKN